MYRDEQRLREREIETETGIGSATETEAEAGKDEDSILVNNHERVHIHNRYNTRVSTFLLF